MRLVSYRIERSVLGKRTRRRELILSIITWAVIDNTIWLVKGIAFAISASCTRIMCISIVLERFSCKRSPCTQVTCKALLFQCLVFIIIVL